jgi:hypothetical protein
MSVPDCVQVRAGPAPWLVGMHLLLPALGILAMLSSNIDLHWVLAWCGLIPMVSAAGVLRLSRHSPIGRLRLFPDGTASLIGADGAVRAVQDHGSWVTRWLCVIPLVRPDSGQTLRCVVCRSLNRADNWRRLMAWLRLRSTGHGHPGAGSSW